MGVQAKGIGSAFHCFHADAGDEDVSRGVVTPGNHQRGNIRREVRRVPPGGSAPGNADYAQRDQPDAAV